MVEILVFVFAINNKTGLNIEVGTISTLRRRSFICCLKLHAFGDSFSTLSASAGLDMGPLTILEKDELYNYEFDCY